MFKLLQRIEADPVSQKKNGGWVYNTIQSIGTRNTLDVFEEAPKDQKVCMSENPIGGDEFVYIIGSTQIGKTLAFLSSVLEVAYTSKMAPIIMSMNSIHECSRFQEAAIGFNKTVRQIASFIGVEVPSLKMYDSKTITNYKKAVTNWLTNQSLEIPVYVVMANKSKTEQFKNTIMPFLKEKFGVNENERVNMFVTVDEADLLYKSDEKVSALEKAIFFNGIHQNSSTIIYVTASPQSFVTNKVPIEGRVITVLEVSPSKNNFQYHVSTDCVPRIVERRIASNVSQMVNDMVKDNESRVALITTSNKSSVKDRSKKAFELATLHSDIENLVVFSWSSDQIEIFTGDRAWVKFFNDCTGLKTERCSKKVFNFSNKTKNDVDSYPKIITYIVKNKVLSGPMKFFLFGKMMCERAVPIKGVFHEFPLTDMYFESEKMHHEGMIQSLGRVCGLDRDAVSKRIWTSRKTHKHHIMALKEVEQIVTKFLPFGKSSLDAMKIIQKTVVDLTTDCITESTVEFVEDIDDALSMVNSRMTRPGANKRARIEKSETKSLLKSNKRIKFSACSFVSSYIHSDIPEEESDSEDEDEGGMEEALQNSKDGLLVKIVSLVEQSAYVCLTGKKCLGVKKISEILSGEEEYPDGTSFKPLAFIKYISVKCVQDLSEKGVIFQDGKFCLK